MLDSIVNRIRNEYRQCGKTLDWLESYLTDRYQPVHINMIKNYSSEKTKLNCGVPQGVQPWGLYFSDTMTTYKFVICS